MLDAGHVRDARFWSRTDFKCEIAAEVDHDGFTVHGVGWSDIALTLNRIAVGGTCYALGYHKLFNAERHRTFVDELKALGVPAVGFNQWWVPCRVRAGGAVLVGLLAPLAALGLCHHSRRHRHVRAAANWAEKPIDEGDRIDDWLYLPETLYAFMLIIIVSGGAGPCRIHALILGLTNKHAA